MHFENGGSAIGSGILQLGHSLQVPSASMYFLVPLRSALQSSSQHFKGSVSAVHPIPEADGTEHFGQVLHSAVLVSAFHVERSLYLPESQVFELTQVVLVSLGYSPDPHATFIVESSALVPILSLDPKGLQSPAVLGAAVVTVSVY